MPHGIPVVELGIGNFKVKAHIDSGNMVGGFIVQASLVEKLNFAAPPVTVGKARTISNEIEIKEVRLSDTIKLGRFEFPQPTITFPATSRNDSKSEVAVFVMKVDGSERRQVTHIAPEEGGAQWPVWSPNGRELATQVNSRLHRGSAHIWIIDVATGAARKLAAHDKTYLDETPSWFPDGKRIAFQSNRTGRMEVWLMNVDGSGQRQVTGLK